LADPIPISDKKMLIEKVRSGLSFLKNKSPKFLQPYLTKSNFIIFLIIGFFLIQYLQISSMTGGVSSLSLRGSSLVDEVGKLNQVTAMLGQDLNEVRSFLVMPTKRYFDDDLEDASQDSDSNQDALQLALFKYVSHLGEQENLHQKLNVGLNDLNTLFSNESFKNYLNSAGLTISSISESANDWHLSIIDGENRTILYIYLDKTTGDINVQNVSGKMIPEVLESETFASHLESYLKQNLDTISSSIKQLTNKKNYILESFNNESIRQIFESRKLSASTSPIDKDFKLFYEIKNESKEVVAEVILDKKDFSIQLKDYRDSGNVAVKVTDLVSAIPPFVESLDTIPEVQKKVIEAKAKLSATLDDKGFKVLLEKLNLSIPRDPREDEYRYYYDIYAVITGKTKLLGSIVVEKATGIVNIVDPNGTNTTNILFFDPGLKKKL